MKTNGRIIKDEQGDRCIDCRHCSLSRNIVDSSGHLYMGYMCKMKIKADGTAWIIWGTQVSANKSWNDGYIDYVKERIETKYTYCPRFDSLKTSDMSWQML